MNSRTVTVGSSVGLHARPAALIAHAASAAPTPVTIAKGDGAPVDAGSALMIMTLGAHLGDAVTIEGEDAAVVDQIAELLSQDLDAQP